MFLHAKLYLAKASRSRGISAVNGHHISLVAGVLLMSLSSVLASSSSWDFLLHQNVEHTDRSRRDVDNASDPFPPSLTFAFSPGTDHVKLRLRKNEFLSTSPPLFFIRRGKLVQERADNFQTDHAFYQDRKAGAAVMVRRSPDGGRYRLTGSYFHKGREYSIQPITDAGSSDVDHKVYRLLGGTDLEYDVISFNSDHFENIAVTDMENNTINPDPNIKYGKSETPTTEVSHYHETFSWRSSTDNISEGSSRTHGDGNKAADGYSNDTAGISDDRSGYPAIGVGERESRKRRREADIYVVELTMVIDYGVYLVWRDSATGLSGEAQRKETLRRITQFYSFVLNGIDLRYSSVQRVAGFNVDVTWAGIIVFDNPVVDYWKGAENPPKTSRDRVESSVALEAFRGWAGSMGAELPPSDHVMLFTGHNLTYGGSLTNAGLAYLGSACNPDYFFSVVEEYFDFRDVAIAAHELGHSLGARHDMDGNVCLAHDRYIMTSRFQFPSQRKAKNPWFFSECSVQYFKDFIQDLDRNGTNCLVVQESTAQREISPFLTSLPGQVYPGDDFCRIGEGPESYICREQHARDYTSICFSGVFCYRSEEKACLLKLPPDGFSCGNRRWCVSGTCQKSDSAPETLSDDCPFGDSPDRTGDPTCAERVMNSRSECYKENFRARCCASCHRHRRNLPGCEYGDHFELCNKDQCASYDLDYARENCCDTCADLLFTLPTTMETKTISSTSNTLPPIGNTERTGNVSSRRGENSDARRNRITSPDSNKQTERRGQTRDFSEQKGQKSSRRRGESSESEGSEESGEVASRRYEVTRDNTEGEMNNPRENLAMIRNLLGGIRKSHDSSRSQRMRLFSSLLDRIRRENLGTFQNG